MRVASLIAIFALIGLQNAPQVFQATIEGVVTDGTTNWPMPDVNVYLLDVSQMRPLAATPLVTTGDQGTFSFRITSPGRYRVLPQISGFVYSRPARVQSLQAGVVISVAQEGVQKVTLAMVREGTISGQILDASGRPLSGVDVNLFARVYGSTGTLQQISLSGILALTRPVVTDDRGEYRYFGLPQGAYMVGVPGALGSPFVFYPGVDDASRAVLVQVDSGQEARLSPMTVIGRSVPVHFRYEDPAGRFTRKSLTMGANTYFSVSSWSQSPVEPEIVLAMSQGRHEFTLNVSSTDGELRYAPVTLDVGDEELFLNPQFKPGLRVTGALKLQDEAGNSLDSSGIRCFLTSEAGGVSAHTNAYGCIGGQFSPGYFRLTMSDMPPDAYVVSARSGDRNVLSDGIQINNDTELEILLSTPGSSIDGIVTNDSGEALEAAVVALIPDAPLRNALPLYRSDITTHDGSFQLRGIGPGSYRLLAWNDLPGAAYLDATFMKL